MGYSSSVVTCISLQAYQYSLFDLIFHIPVWFFHFLSGQPSPELLDFFRRITPRLPCLFRFIMLKYPCSLRAIHYPNKRSVAYV